MSFVRSITMDKWKDIELEKMKVGGNRAARLFLESQDDYNDSAPILERYNTRAAALLRDKVRALSTVKLETLEGRDVPSQSSLVFGDQHTS